jgi:hypothetical protein
VAAIPVHDTPLAGLVLNTLLDAASTPANGDTCPTGTRLIARNTGGGALTITVATPGTVDGDLAIADRAFVAVPATSGLAEYPITGTYRDPATGLATLTFSGTTGLKVIAVRGVV